MPARASPPPRTLAEKDGVMRHFLTLSKAHYGATAAHTVCQKSVEATELENRSIRGSKLHHVEWVSKPVHH